MKNLLYIPLFLLLTACSGKTSLEYQALAEMYYKTGKLEKSLSNYNKALDKDESNIQARAQRGALLFEMQKYNEALLDFTEVKKAAPDYAEGYSAAGAALAALGELLPARENLLKAIELNPKNPQAYATLGGLYYATANYKASIEEYSKALAIMPDALIYTARGMAYLNYGKQEQAKADFAAAGLSEDQYPKAG